MMTGKSLRTRRSPVEVLSGIALEVGVVDLATWAVAATLAGHSVCLFRAPRLAIIGASTCLHTMTSLLS
jgi:hypothetical protein